MIDWIGAFCSAAGLFYQYVNEKKKEKSKDYLIKTMLELSRKLKKSKEVHACFQYSHYTTFKPNLTMPEDKFYSSRHDNWDIIYREYGKITSIHGIEGIRMETTEEKEQLVEKVEAEYKKNPDLKNVVDDVLFKNFVMSYSKTIRLLKKIHDKVEKVNEEIEGGGFKYVRLKQIDRELDELLLLADASIKYLIDILERVISKMNMEV
jgi:hypothetical protein